MEIIVFKYPERFTFVQHNYEKHPIPNPARCKFSAPWLMRRYLVLPQNIKKGRRNHTAWIMLLRSRHARYRNFQPQFLRRQIPRHLLPTRC